MLIIDLDSIQQITGSEGTQIKQIFHPHNTMLGIRYSMAQCKIEPGKSSKPHKLKSSEVYFIITGQGVLHIDDESCSVKRNQAVYIPPHSRQFIQNVGKTSLEFLCIVDPAWQQENEITG
jgi:mannose-6-phosphate isomerase-like protein (cupin superfamily)